MDKLEFKYDVFYDCDMCNEPVMGKTGTEAHRKHLCDKCLVIVVDLENGEGGCPGGPDPGCCEFCPETHCW